MTIIYFLLILGVVVFIHEFGHFIFAKKAGIYVYEFSIGMGPRIFKFNRYKKIKTKDGKIKKVKDETDYCLRLFPIGGFVQMAGEEIEVDENIPENMRLQNKKWHQRFLVMVAGVMNNFILAFVILLIIGWTNTISTHTVYIDQSIVDGLNTGDEIIKVGGKKTSYYDKLALELTVESYKLNEDISDFNITVKDKNGDKKDVSIKPIKIGKSELVFGRKYEFKIEERLKKGTKDEYELVIKESKNEKLKKGLIIVAVDNVNVSNSVDFLEAIRDKEDSITLIVKDSDGKITEVTTKVEEEKDDELLGYSYGFTIDGPTEKGFIAGIKYAFSKFFHTLSQMFWTIVYLISGDISLNLLSGPVGIYKVVDQAASIGIMSVLSLVALLNINVGFINILPLPAFDGGHALFLIIEKIKGSPVNPKYENIIHSIFFVLLMLLMIYVTFNDILKLF